MKLILDKKHGNRLEVLGDVSLTFANMVRRYSMSRVPVLAIDKVTFYENTSAFWDEYISHRLGLLPILTPEGAPASAEITFSLDAEGPKSVYASDMASTDKEITIAKGGIPVMTLGTSQRVRLEAKAVFGTARTHSKFQAGIVSYGEEKGGLRIIVESFFQMEPYEVLTRGCDAVENDLDEMLEALGEKPAKKKKAEDKAEKEAEKAAKKAEKEAEKAEKKAQKEKEKEEKAAEKAEEKEEKKAKKEKKAEEKEETEEKKE